MAESTLRDSLEKAYEQTNEQSSGPPQEGADAGGGSELQTSTEPPESLPSGAPTTDGAGAGDASPPVQELAPKQEGEPGAQPPAPAQPGVGQEDKLTQGPEEGSSVKPPRSWRPEVREHWAKLPPEVQQEVIRRETQVMRTMNEASQYIQRQQQFENICAPYSSMIAMDGGNPLNTFQEYLKTAALLRMGAPQEKATAIANAVLQFGIDVEQLDAALAQRMGKGGQGAPQAQASQQQFRDPRLDQLLGEITQHRQSRQEQISQAQQAEIDNFVSDPKNEFFDDVRPMVANILELYANQGIKCSLKEAYDKACMLDPNVSKVLEARKQAQNRQSFVRQNNNSLEAKRRAALMPPGAPNIGPGAEDNGDMSLRDTIAAAMDQRSQRV